MELPVLIERLPDGVRYMARLGEPFNLTVEGSSPDEAQQRLSEVVLQKLQQGAQLRSLRLPSVLAAETGLGWLPDDDLTREWLQAIQEFRTACDEADHRRIAENTCAGKAAP
jgi:predicted RNase H-like HicB family nuclease